MPNELSKIWALNGQNEGDTTSGNRDEVTKARAANGGNEQGENLGEEIGSLLSGSE